MGSGDLIRPGVSGNCPFLVGPAGSPGPEYPPQTQLGCLVRGCPRSEGGQPRLGRQAAYLGCAGSRLGGRPPSRGPRGPIKGLALESTSHQPPEGSVGAWSPALSRCECSVGPPHAAPGCPGLSGSPQKLGGLPGRRLLCSHLPLLLGSLLLPLQARSPAPSGLPPLPLPEKGTGGVALRSQWDSGQSGSRQVSTVQGAGMWGGLGLPGRRSWHIPLPTQT